MFFCLKSYIQGITCECCYIHILKDLPSGVSSEDPSQSSVLQNGSRWGMQASTPAQRITPGGINALGL